jgi:hypothetical protein
MRQDPETVLTVVHAARTSLQKPLTHTAIQSLRHVVPANRFAAAKHASSTATVAPFADPVAGLTQSWKCADARPHLKNVQYTCGQKMPSSSNSNGDAGSRRTPASVTCGALQPPRALLEWNKAGRVPGSARATEIRAKSPGRPYRCTSPHGGAVPLALRGR